VFLQILDMPFSSFNKIPVILILFIFLTACNKKPTLEFPEDVVAEINDTLARMQQSLTKYQELTPAYLASKKPYVEHFANRSWPVNSANISFLVAKDGKIIYEKYQGYANKNLGSVIVSDTPLHIASVSKVLTATAILELIDKGKINLNTKVNSILKSFPYPEITLQTLLNHRSGLRNYAYFTEDKGVWDRKKPLTNVDLLRILGEKNIQTEYPNDKRFTYCNTNYAILALIIEKVTGLKFPVAMNEMIFKPLGMKNTFVFDYFKDRSTIVPSYKGNNVEIGIDYLDCVYGDKNIYSTPRDLLKFDLARNSPRFLKPDLLAKVYKGYSNERKGTKNYGLGIRMINWETGQNFYFHNGWWHGNTSSYISLKKENVVIIALSNKFNSMTYKVRNLAPLFGNYPFDLKELED